MEQNKKYNYTYTAQNVDERKEVERIRNAYISPEENKLEQLRRLNAKVYQQGMVVSMSVGIVGTLILGVGMTCVLVWSQMILGIIIGVVGLAVLGVAYPLNTKLVNQRKAELGPEIIKLSNEILNDK
ncbi:MAG TPA: hypothetical protein PKA81_13165 [Clostridia bacterium]|jgi:cytosine/uracil/thiamine/allantoin permease|nr:hypothetical protein [Clostridia bacterium]